ncbi:MAG: hypothetical protein JWP57_1789, partial [Spirosoma sp.]|nr:hypothetical protein [Spirosoma sp.]
SIERVSGCYRGRNKFQSEAMKRQGFEKGRISSKWMNGRTNIVTKSGQCQLSRTHPSTDGWLSFDQQH